MKQKDRPHGFCYLNAEIQKLQLGKLVTLTGVYLRADASASIRPLRAFGVVCDGL